MTHIFRRHWGTALLLLSPALLFAAVFLLYPLLNGVYLSFTNASALRPTHRVIGLGNYQYLLSTPEFFVVLWNSALLVGGAILLSMVGGLALALMVNRRLPGTTLFRAGVFQIWIVPWISVAILWGWIFNADYGIVNHLLTSTGLVSENVRWFSDSTTARLVVVLGFAWRMIPFMMVVSLAALQSIPSEILEAADVDGATPVQRFLRITLPLLRPMLVTLALLQLVKLFQEITLPWVLTQGGPVNSTTTLSLYTYKLAFQQWDYGLAATAGTIWLVLLGLLGLTAMQLTRRRYD
ncbi:sugar ABC transporter permease [Chelativorans sp. AA-79]|uniref:carbohydrate ABC transporter permease n=1 Tax=Chelativorans sp. AA-79 TaxID=3028735 RepID=UPI0023F7CD1F|nr:sugar ABC transporter permease [Chelativorans sp. AA-79]WEX10963.1 sugar ABC transporter permease [Chelativorans sp. AA-79]